MVAVFAAMHLPSVASQDPSVVLPIPNIEMMEWGTILVKACPFCLDDPGRPLKKIFDYSYDPSGGSVHSGWWIPSHLELTPEAKCAYSESKASTSTATSKDAVQRVTVSTTMTMPEGDTLKGAAASASLYHATSVWSGGETYYATYSARCTSFALTIQGQPKLQPVFADRVRNFDFSDNYTSSHRLVQDFGSHFSQAGSFGAIALVSVQITQNGYSQLVRDGVDVDVGVQLAFYKKIGMDISSHVGYEHYVSLMAASAQSRIDKYFSPAPPPTPPNEYDDYAWVSHVQLGSDPAPTLVWRKQSPVTDLLTSDFFPDVPYIQDIADVVGSYLAYEHCQAVHGCEFLTGYEGMTTWFNSSSGCPDGWEAAVDVQGRLVMAVNDPVHAGYKHMHQPLRDLQDPAHSHTAELTVSINDPQVQIADIVCVEDNGGCHHLAGRGGLADMTGALSLDIHSSGFPLMHLLPCKVKRGLTSPVAAHLRVPMGSVAFFDDETLACPLRWQPLSDEWSNRTLVANVAENAYPRASLSTLTIGQPLAHRHELGMSITFGPSDWLFNSPARNTIYAEDKSARVNSSAADFGFPYISMLTCVKVQDDPVHDLTWNPSGMTLFTANNFEPVNNGCPQGWRKPDWAEDKFGRLIIGATLLGNVSAVYGSLARIEPGLTFYNNTHTHTAAESHVPWADNFVIYADDALANTPMVRAGADSFAVRAHGVSRSVFDLPFAQMLLCVPEAI